MLDVRARGCSSEYYPIYLPPKNIVQSHESLIW